MRQDEDSIYDYTEYETDMCSLPASTKCDHYYFVVLNSLGSSIYVVEPQKYLLLRVWAIATIILVGLTVIIVVILILAKLVVMYHDYREVQAFKKELKTADLTKVDNPMYQTPTVTYKNIAYGKEDTADNVKEHYVVRTVSQ